MANRNLFLESPISHGIPIRIGVTLQGSMFSWKACLVVRLSVVTRKNMQPCFCQVLYGSFGETLLVLCHLAYKRTLVDSISAFLRTFRHSTTQSPESETTRGPCADWSSMFSLNSLPRLPLGASACLSIHVIGALQVPRSADERKEVVRSCSRTSWLNQTESEIQYTYCFSNFNVAFST